MKQENSQRIRELLEKGSLAASATDSVVSMPPEVEESPSTDQNPEMRFEIGELIGAGNMGQVYRAMDRKLQRTVALKFVPAESGALLSRFLREARTQAKVEHENIAKVYEVGEWNGKAYIAMQHIQGQPLGQAAREMTLEQKVHVMIQVAEAVHAAHRTGFIHRDLKPGNVLVERTLEGWKPYVVDFGLARDDNSTGTKTGMIAGSPAYMAPEQARGEIRHLDRRTDVYGLGATLFEVLCGRPPFEGAGAEVLVHVLQEEPPLLRSIDPAVPADLEAIVEKCLQKEPQHRYESAQGLALDLHRYAAGDIVEARRRHWSHRAIRKIRRNPRVSATVAAAVVVSLILGHLWIRERWRAAERMRLTQEYTQQAERLQSFLRYSYMLPLHDLNPEKTLVRKSIRSMELNLQQTGDLAIGPGHSAIGRAFLQLQDYDRARFHLELALRNGMNDAETSLALGQTLGALYQQGLQQAARLSGFEREKRKQQLQQDLRDPALRLLQAGGSRSLDSAHYVKGLIEFYDGNYETALKDAREAIRATPWLYEARKLEGDIHLMSGIEKRKKEFWTEALTDYSRAHAAYESAIQMARSDPELRLSECEQGIQHLEVSTYVEREFPKNFNGIVDLCKQVLAADSSNAEAHYKLSRIFYRAGDYAFSHGQPFQELFQQAIADGEKAVALNSNNNSYYDFVTAPLARLAWYKWEHGLDPQQDLQRMIVYSERVKDHAQVVIGHLLKAEIAMDTGRDANASLEAASLRVERVRESAPDSAEIYNLRGSVLLARAKHEQLQGNNPVKLLDEASANYERVREVYPKYPLPYLHLADTHLSRSEFEYGEGRDPSAHLDLATTTLQQALQLDPHYASALLLMSRILRQRALHEIRAGVSPESSLSEADDRIHLALTINPDDASAYRCRSRIQLDWADYKRFKGLPITSQVQAAEIHLQMARDKNPQHFELHLLTARLCLLKARQPDAAIWRIQAKAALQKGLDLNLTNPELRALAEEVQ